MADAGAVGEDGRLIEVVWPDGLDPSGLPTYLALPMWEYLSEPNPRVRLHWMLDTLEVALRWAVAVLMAEVIADNDGALPPMLKKVLQGHIERPTVGRWVGMMRTLSAAAPSRPALCGDIFSLHDDHIAPLFTSDGLETESMLVLRNRVAHGGGLSTRMSAELLAAHDPRFIQLMRTIAGCTRGLLVCARHTPDGESAEQILDLSGLSPAPCASPPSLPEGPADAAWLTDGSTALSLSPLVAYGPIRVLDKNGQFILRDPEPVPQIYARASAQSLSYTPLGRDEAHAERPEVDAFRALFGLDEARRAGGGQRRGFAPGDFVREADAAAEGLVGRVTELKTIKTWLKRCKTRESGAQRMAWLRAGPGIGKSSLMARIARDLSNSSHHGMYFHHFQTGDVRNNRRMFLQLLQEALWEWAPLKARTAPPSSGGDVDELTADVTERLEVLGKLTSKNPRAPAPSFRILLDGLDAVMPQDPDFPVLIRQLNLPGSAWLIAGRPDHGLGATFAAEDVHTLFADAGGVLPAMSTDDIRALLLEGLGNARYALLKRDEEAGDSGEAGAGVRNAFVERVVERAGGLPLYVELLLDDLRSGVLTVDDEDALPDGLNTYYANLIARMGISDVQVNLTLLVCLLARSEEPLDRLSVRYLLSPSLDIGDEVLEPEEAAHIGAVLRAGRTLLRETVAPSGERAFVLYHNGFREYINGTEGLKRTRRRAEALLYQTAHRWFELPDSNLRSHLFRYGTEYALWWGGKRGLRATRERLTDFGYLMARTHALPAFENLKLAREFSRVHEALPGDPVFADWEIFIQANEHLLRRGTDLWPADRILLQRAMEYADSSQITQAAEAWLTLSGQRWLWLRREKRPVHVSLFAFTAVMEGHSRKIDGAHLFTDQRRVLSWSLDNSLRLWDVEAGTCLLALEGHSKRVRGARVLPDEGRAVSFSDDGAARVWDLETGDCLQELVGHDGKNVEDAVLLGGGRLATCGRDRAKTVKVWDMDSGACLLTLSGHKRYVRRLHALPDGQLLSIDRSIRLWDAGAGAETPVHTLSGHGDEVYGVAPLPDHGLLSWSKDGTLRLWSLSDGAQIHTLEGHGDEVTGAMLLSDGAEALSWSKDGTLRLWSLPDGAEQGVLSGHSGPVLGARVLGPERLLSWADGGELIIWDRLTLTPLHRLEGHDGSVQGTLQLSDGRLLALSSRGAVDVWDADAGRRIVRLSGHSTGVEGAAELPGGRLLTWSSDRTVRVWSMEPALLARIAEIDAANHDPDEHEQFVAGTRQLDDGRILSWSKDTTLRLWGAEGVESMFRGHSGGVDGARILGGEDRVVSWGDDYTIRIWRLSSGELLHTLDGHSKKIQGVRLLPDRQMLSWSSDYTLRIWDVDSGAERAVLKGHKKLVKGADRLKDGRILSWGSDGTVRLWADDGAPLLALEGHNARKVIEGACQLDDGRFLSWCSDSTLRLWGADGKEQAVMEGHDAKKSVKGAAVLRDGRILSWSNDSTLRLWSPQGEALAALEGHTGTVFFATELEDGRIISAGDDNAFRLWSAEGEALDAIAADKAPLAWTEAWMAWKGARRSLWSCGVGVIDELAGGVRLMINDEDGPVVIPWHGPRGRWFADSISDDGRIIARDTASLYFLRLYHGGQRIDLEQAQEIIT